ncbi:MAG: ImmA/IrrE family metallo-endopeptidase [Gemmatimonadetes bacterium]|nr:ImmA/IrrE family metallo-endopeptidase [Gemmatimonadota bacterium]
MAACDRLGVAYNSEFSPLSDLTFAVLLTRAGVRWRYAPLEGGICEIVWPPIYGVHLMQIDKHLTTAERRFAMRHGLAHVLDGHLRDLTPAADSGDWRSYEEAVADLFALVDLVPDHQIDTLPLDAAESEQLEEWVRQQATKHVSGWSEERLDHRARVRAYMHRWSRTGKKASRPDSGTAG